MANHLYLQEYGFSQNPLKPPWLDNVCTPQIETQLSIASRILAASSFLDKGLWRNDIPFLSTPWLAIFEILPYSPGKRTR